MRFANVMACLGAGDPEKLLKPEPEEPLTPEELVAEGCRNADAIAADIAASQRRAAGSVIAKPNK
jgi:hypothetical protein